MAIKEFFQNLFKTVPGVDNIGETTREGLQKAVIPNFLYKPPYGYPRFLDLPSIRRFAKTPYVEMCLTTIIDEFAAVEWNVVPKEESDEISPETQAHIDHVAHFLDNPNTNKENWEILTKKLVRDILEIDSGVLIKVFNLSGEMVELVARDGVTFTKNPDLHGMFTNRTDIIMIPDPMYPKTQNVVGAFNPQPIQEIITAQAGMEDGHTTTEDVRELAAYFQYGWITGARPVPFGKRELIWFEKNPRTNDIYGHGAVEILSNTVQTLIYAIEHDLGIFNDNSIPGGVLALEGADSDTIKAFKQQWKEQQRMKDSAGNWKKVFHRMPIVNKKPEFTRIQLTNQDMQLLESQKWWAKLVWGCFGVTPTELGFTEDAKGMANQIVQSNNFRKRALNPLLRLIEYRINSEIIPEFGYEDVKFQYNMFDVEEETKKTELYKLQTEVGIKTVNEIRRDEGMDEVEWGDDDPKRNQGNNFNIGNPRNPQEDEQSRYEKESSTKARGEGQGVGGSRQGDGGADYCVCPKCDYKVKHEKGKSCNEKKCPKCGVALTGSEKKKIDKKDVEGKPGMGRSNKWWDIYHALIEDGYSKESASKIAYSRTEGKSMQTLDNPLIPKENEVFDSDKLERSIIYLLKLSEDKIKALIKKEVGKESLMQIKSLDDLAKAIKNLISFQGLKSVSDKVISDMFMEAWYEAEKKVNKNFRVNKGAIAYIQDYTFNNIKNLSEELTNDLRAELERGIMAGDGVTKMTERVSNVFNKGEARAEAIARTETNRAQGQGQLQAFKSSGDRYQKKWVTHFDKRTSGICKRLDGQVVDMNENFKDEQSGWEGPTHPAHISCRSSVVFILKE